MLRRGSLPRQDDRDDRSRVRIKRGARVTTAQRHRTPTQFFPLALDGPIGVGPQELRARLVAPDLDPDERTAIERRLRDLEAQQSWAPARGAHRRYTPQVHLFAAERSDEESVRTGTAAPVHVLVRGETGSGKSTLLQALALGAAGHAPTLAAEHPDLFRAVVGRFPVCLALADYAATLDSRPTPPLRDHPRADARADT